MPRVFSGVEPKDVAVASDVPFETMERIAGLVATSGGVLAIPGGPALGQSNGLAVAQAVLALNAFVDNLGKPGGVYISGLAPAQSEYNRAASAMEMQDLVDKMASGAIKALFIHGVNPVFELPASIDFKGALANVEQVISFATFPDETSALSHYVFPDHHGLESWGYQRVVTGAAQPVLSGSQPVVSPFYNTRATADVLIAAAQLAGGKFAEALPYKDEVEFLSTKVSALMSEADGSFSAPEAVTFMAYFQQYGGWWKKSAALATPASDKALDQNIVVANAEFSGEGEFFFVPFVSPTLAESGANKPWLQELPDPTTTVMWNTWIEINPKTAEELGLANDDMVKVTSEAGEVQAYVYLYPAIRPDTVAMPFGQGHTAYGRYAENRGANPANLISGRFNEAGDLAFAGMKVKVEKIASAVSGVGLSRMESRLGVYGEFLGKEE